MTTEHVGGAAAPFSPVPEAAVTDGTHEGVVHIETHHAGVCGVAMLDHLHLLRDDLARATVPREQVLVAANVIEHLICLCMADRFAPPTVLRALKSIEHIEATHVRAAELKAMVQAVHDR